MILFIIFSEFIVNIENISGCKFVVAKLTYLQLIVYQAEILTIFDTLVILAIIAFIVLFI